MHERKNKEESPAEEVCVEVQDRGSDSESDVRSRMLAAVFASMGDAVYYTDCSRRILDWNGAAEKMTGYRADEVRGAYCCDILSHTDQNGKRLCPSGCPLMEASIHSETVSVQAVWLKKKDGQRLLVEMNCARVMNERGELLGMVEVFRDRTKQWETERMKEDFVAAITHDLKSPLASIMGFTELLASPKTGEIPSNKLEYIKMIRHSGNMLLALISNIVDAARIEAGQMNLAVDDFSLDEFLKELQETFLYLAERGGVEIDFSGPGDTWVQGDRGKLLQVFHNLISNALRYTPRGGKITVRSWRDNGLIHFEVSDTGRGIPSGEQERLFQKFAQAKGERRGTGLGLYIVKTIMELHGSAIRLESEEGHGTHFFFALKEVERPPEEAPVRSAKILLAGEDSDSLRLVRLILQKDGHEVDSVESGLEALQRVTASIPDIIMIHYPLPDLIVEDFLYGINSVTPANAVAVVLLSSINVVEWEKKFAAFVPLPVNMPILRETVRRILKTRSA